MKKKFLKKMEKKHVSVQIYDSTKDLSHSSNLKLHQRELLRLKYTHFNGMEEISKWYFLGDNMIVVHSIWNPDKKLVGIWAETNENLQPKRFLTLEAIHPFSVQHTELFQIVTTLYSSHISMDSPDHFRQDWQQLRLPSKQNHPLVSPSLDLHANEIYSLCQKDQPNSKPKSFLRKTANPSTDLTKSENSRTSEALGPPNTIDLIEWQVPVIWITLPGIIEQSFMTYERNISLDLRFSASFKFWKNLSTFGLKLFLTQGYTPYFKKVETHPQTFTGGWKMIMSEENVDQLERIASAMPSVCQPRSTFFNQKPNSAMEISLHFVNSFLDKYIRQNLQQLDLAYEYFQPTTKSGLPRKNSSLNKKWGHALISQSINEGEITFHTEESDSTILTMKNWFNTFQPSQTDTTSSFRTCFKLIPPDELENQSARRDPQWKIQFYLQAKSDLSLLVPASEIWKIRSNTFIFLKHQFENPQEKLLSDLEKSSHIFPKIEKSLHKAHPNEVSLSLNEAYHFLRTSTPLLKQEGFGIIIPGWWDKPQNHLGLSLKIKPLKLEPNPIPQKAPSNISVGKFGLADLVEFQWEVALGENLLSQKEFEKFAQLKVPLVQIRGQWLELKSEDLKKIVTYFDANRNQPKITGQWKPKSEKITEKFSGTMPLQEALQLGMGLRQSTFDLPIINFTGSDGMEELVEKFKEPAVVEEIITPSTFQGILRPYQMKGVSWLLFLQKYGIGACLADDMGLGKTIQIIALLLIEKQTQSPTKHEISEKMTGSTLVICPLSVAVNWAKEISKFGPSLKTLVYHGSSRLTGQKFFKQIHTYDIIITTYGLVRRNQDLFTPITWNHLILDESQNIKNASSLQSQAIKKIPARHRIALSGTPIENRLAELWSLEDFLNPGFLEKRSVFHKKFALPIEKYNDENQREKLKKLVEPLILRRLKSDKNIVKDLPEKIEANIFCNLKVEQATLYKAVVQDMVEQIAASDGIQRKGLILSSIMKLKQICNHPAQFLKDRSQIRGRSLKLERVKEMLEEIIQSHEKALIFTQFKTMGLMMQEYLQHEFQTEIPFLYGATTKNQRENMIQSFQHPNSELSVMILSLKAGGIGINLTAANHVFHFDRWWNPAVENQASDRVYRIGQTKNVNVYKFITLGTIEEKMDEIIKKKQKLAESIIGSNERWITELDNEKIKELFTYRDTI